MFERLIQLVREYAHGPIEPETEERSLFQRLEKEGCTVCEDNPEFMVIEGPQGGMSQNVWCAKCGTRYFISEFPSPDGKPFGIAEIITEREREEEFKGQRDEQG